MKKRYEVGLEKLATTESSVADMQQELIALQPQLEESTKETEAAMVVSRYAICCEHFAWNHMQAFNFGSDCVGYAQLTLGLSGAFSNTLTGKHGLLASL